MGYSGQRRPPPACWRASPLSPWRVRRSPLGVLSSEPWRHRTFRRSPTGSSKNPTPGISRSSTWSAPRWARCGWRRTRTPRTTRSPHLPMRTAAVWTSKSSSIRIPRSRHQPSSLRCASRRRRRHQMGAQRCDLPPETHRRRPHYRRRRYRKPHQEVLRDLARCLHSHHQHQRRRRHRRHLRHPLHRRAPRKWVPVRASRRRVCDPRPGRRLCQLAQHDHSLCVGRRRRDWRCFLNEQGCPRRPPGRSARRNLPRKPLLPTGVPDKAIDEARLAGLPLSGGRDEEVLAAHSAHSQRCPSRVLPGHHRIGAGAPAAWAFRWHLLTVGPRMQPATSECLPTNLPALASSASMARSSIRPNAVVGR